MGIHIPYKYETNSASSSVLSPKSNAEIESALDKLSNIDKFSIVLKFRLDSYIEKNSWGQLNSIIENYIRIIREVAYKYNVVVKIKEEIPTNIISNGCSLEVFYKEKGQFLQRTITILLNA